MKFKISTVDSRYLNHGTYYFKRLFKLKHIFIIYFKILFILFKHMPNNYLF